jgi:hypothetical protein
VSDEARAAWKRKHRRQRMRAPKVEAARKVAAVIMALATLAFIALGVFVEWGWGTGAFVCGYLFLRLMGVRPFEGSGDDSGIGTDAGI